MREDFPAWLGKPPRRGTDAWEAWLQKWRTYARLELKDTAADDPEFDFGLLSVEERWLVALSLEIRKHLALGQAGERCPWLEIRPRAITDQLHAAIVAWQVGWSVHSTEADAQTEAAEAWVTLRTNPRRRKIAHGIRYGFLAGLGGEAAAPTWSTPDYVAAYEAAWAAGNDLAISQDPR